MDIEFKEPFTSRHIDWFKATQERLQTLDGKEVQVWEFCHEKNNDVLSAWAKHFRNHYCLDSDIDFMRGQNSRADYLTGIKFPSQTSSLGPSVRAGDFGEILVSDFLQWICKLWVPRVRWGSKVVRDESPKGSDVIGFKLINKDEPSNHDILAIFETKTKFSKNANKNRLQEAVNDSAKDHIRIDESLNYIKQKLFEKNQIDQAKQVERFQSPVDSPYQESYGAAAIITEEYFSRDEITNTDTTKILKSSKSGELISHPKNDQLFLLVIKGVEMMELVHELYKRAADEA